MPAPSYEALFNHQELIENAFAAYFKANGLTVYETGSRGTAPDDYIAVHFQLGAATGHNALRAATGTGEQEEDWYNGNFIVGVETTRHTKADSTLSGVTRKHVDRVCKIRTLMLRGKLNTSADFSLEYLSVYHLHFAGQTDEIADDQRAIDRSLLTFQLGYRILPDAWPSA